MPYKITWEPKIFPDNTQPHGCLPDKMGAQACWWNFIRLHKIYQTSGTIEQQTAQATLLETDEWRSKRYLEIKRATGIIYDLDPSYIDQFWPVVTQEARRLGLERKAFTGESFELPVDEYVYAVPGKVIAGHGESK